MDESAPVIAGLGFLATVVIAVVLARRYRPGGWIATELFRPVALKSSGPYRTASRRDRLRQGWLIAVSGPLLFGASLASYSLAQRFDGVSRIRLSIEAYFFAFFLLSIVMTLMGVAVVVGALRVRPTVVRGEPRKLGEDLAAFFEETVTHSYVGRWPDFSAVVYDDPRLEAVRASIVEHFPARRPPILPQDALVLRSLASRVRDATA